MGLFDSAIENMSKMALNEESVPIPQITAPALVDEFRSTLELMPSLNEDEMRFPVQCVPVREATRIGKYLIEMEDLSRYMLTNQVNNLLEAINDIGYVNGIQLNNRNTALVIDESSVLQEMDDLGMNIGGSNSNEGNVGTVGILGVHTDLGKFRRFANSREFVDTVCNKYGIPLVKKNYTIGLIPVKHKDIIHKGNLQENVEIRPKKPNQVVLNEKPDKKASNRYSVNEEMGPGPKFTAAMNAHNEKAEGFNKVDPSNDSMSVMRAKFATTNTSMPNYGEKKTATNEDVEFDESLQYIRDLAYGKLDNELVQESYGGPRVQPNFT